MTELVRINPTIALKPFSCDKEDPGHDLNKFLFEDSVNYLNQLLAVTYIMENEEETIAYFSVLNDSIRQTDMSKSRARRVFRNIPHKKRGYTSHPAVKVGRLAVHWKHQGQKIGSSIMDYVKVFFLKNNKTGCRFITVDAANNPRTIKFYQDNGFDFLTTKDKDNENRLMFCDLIKYRQLIPS